MAKRSPFFVGVSAATADATGNFDLVLPSGTQDGDLLIADIAMRGTAVVTPPSGWAEAVTQRNGGNTSTVATASIASCAQFYIFRGSSAPSLTCTRTGGDVALFRVRAFRYVSSYDTGGSAVLGSNSTTVSMTALDPAGENELMVVGLAGADNISFSQALESGGSDPIATSSNTITTGTRSVGWTHTAVPDVQFAECADSNTTTGADTALALYHAVKADSGAATTVQATASATSRHGIFASLFICQDVPAGYPAIERRISGSSASSTSHNIASSVAGATSSQKLLVMVVYGNAGSISISGWTNIFTSNDGGGLSLSLWEKVGDGSGTDACTVALGSASAIVYSSFIISNVDLSQAIGAGTTATVSAGAPNPPSVTASWGSAKNLFMIALANLNTSPVTVTSWPSNYSERFREIVGSFGTLIHGGYYNEAASDDPPAGGTVESAGLVNTIVIKPATTPAMLIPPPQQHIAHMLVR